MENKTFEKSDMLKFYRNWNPANFEDCNFEEPAYAKLQSILTHAFSKEDLKNVEVVGGYDDLCAFGYHEDGFTLYCDGPLFDECDF